MSQELEVQPYHNETYSSRVVPKGLYGAFQRQGKTPFIRLWCRSRSGHHVTLLVAGFLPYLYVDVSSNVEEEDLDTIQRSLNRLLDTEVRQRDKSEANDRCDGDEDQEPFMWIHHLEIVERINFFGFHRPSKMLKIVLLKPNHVPYVRGLVWENNYLKVEDVAIGPLVYEANIQFHQRFAIDTKILPFSWIKINTADLVASVDNYGGRTDLLACIKYQKCQPLPFDSDQNNAIASFTTMTYDIEVCGPGRAFPDAKNKEDIVGLISYLMHRVGEKQSYSRVSLIAGGKRTDPLPDHEKTKEKRDLVVVTDEKTLLEEFAKGWRKTTPDFLAGYNTDGFDNGYVWDRAERYRMKEFNFLGRCPSDRVVHKKSNFTSKARGKTDDTNWEIPGTVSMDVLRLVRLEPFLKGNLRDFRLDAVAEVLLKDNKVPMDYKLIYPYYTGTPQQRSELADYCDHDAYLAHALMDKQAFIPCYIEMARVTGIRVHDLIVSGQQIKVQSQLLMFCHGTYLIPTIPTANDLQRNVGTIAFETLYRGTKSLKEFTEVKQAKHTMHDFVHTRARKVDDEDDEEDEYLSVGKRKTKRGKHSEDPNQGKDIDAEFEEEAFEGATVLEPLRAYYEVPITTLDFSSLYPSIIIENNLCYSTWLPSVAVAQGFGLGRDDYIITPTGDMFVKRHIREGVLPEVLKHLLTTRGKAKKDKAAAQTEAKRLYELAKKAETEEERERLIIEAESIVFTGSVMDGRQLALKISANSCYGFTGVRYGILPLKAIARSVTSIGRTMIERIKNATEKFFSKARRLEHDAQVVYGDSVSGATPLLLWSPDGGLTFVQAKDLQEKMQDVWSSWGDKESFVPRGWMVWSDQGWATLERVIRHKAPGKMMKRILTHAGFVTVTEDHSLLDPVGEAVKPSQVTIGSQLMHHSLPDSPIVTDTSISKEEEAEAMGLFFEDGSCGSYKAANGLKMTWAINKSDRSLLEHAKGLLEVVYSNTPTTFKILDTLKSGKVYKLVATGDVKAIVERYRPMFYTSCKLKKVPDEILNSSNVIKKAFMKGYYKDPRTPTRFDTKGQIGAAGLYYLCSSLGYNVSINDRSDKPDIFRLTVSQAGSFKKDAQTIKKMSDVGCLNDSEYVYDLQTSNHHFSAGIGTMVVHNTDSIMIKFGYEEVQQGLDLGKRAADINNCLFWQKHVDEDKLKKFLESKCSEDLEEALWNHEEETVKFVSENAKQKSINLLLEKAFFPYLLINKKRYCGGHWLNGMVMDHVATAGIEATRRDNFLFLKTTLDAFIARLVDRDVPGAVTVLQQSVYDLYQGLVSWEDLTFSKGYNKDIDDYKNKEVTQNTHPVFVINARRKARGMLEHQKGNRVPYVYVLQAKTKGKEKNSFYLEDYEWARDHKMIPYIEHYIDFMTDPITRLLDVVLWEGATKMLIFSGEHTRFLRRVPAPTTAKLRADAMQVDPAESKNKQANVGSFFQMKSKEETYQRRLVKPMTSEELQKRKPSVRSIASFVK